MSTIDQGGVGAAGQAAAGAAADQASHVRDVAVGQAGQVAQTAAEQVKQVGGEAVAQTRDLIGDARDELWRQGDQQTKQIAKAISGLRDQARALLDGRPDEAPSLVDHGRGLVDRLDGFSNRLDSGGLRAAVDDVEHFARRRPAVFLAGAGALGFAAGRLLRASRQGPPEPTPGSGGLAGSASPAGSVLPAPMGAPRPGAAWSEPAALSTPQAPAYPPVPPVPPVARPGSVVAPPLVPRPSDDADETLVMPNASPPLREPDLFDAEYPER